MNQVKMMQILSRFRLVIKQFYMALLVVMLIAVARDQLDLIGMWDGLFQKVIVGIEIVGMIVYFGLKVSIKLFEGVEGEVLGTQPHYMVAFWRRTETALLELMLYNGFMGVVLLMIK